MFLPHQSVQQNLVAEDNSTEVKSGKPTTLLIGTSNIAGINETKLTSASHVNKVTAYTLDDTLEVISSTQYKPDVVIIHFLTNDVKNNNPNECMEKLENVVESISTKWSNTKTIVSLTTPRFDNRLHRLNSEILDGLIKKKYLENKDVFVSDNTNLWHGPVPTSELLKHDKFHLTDRGTSMLAANLKNAIHTVLGIERQRRPRYRPNEHSQQRNRGGHNRHNQYGKGRP